MKPYAVIETGGKQYRVSQDETVKVEKLDANAGSDITFDRVLALSDGKALSVGAPHLDGVAIQATVLEHARGRKVVSFKYKKRKGFKKTIFINFPGFLKRFWKTSPTDEIPEISVKSFIVSSVISLASRPNFPFIKPSQFLYTVILSVPSTAATESSQS